MSYEKAYQVAKEFNSTLEVGKGYFNNDVFLTHGDGSMFFFRHATMMYWTDEEGLKSEKREERRSDYDWVFIFTEHHGLHVYCVEDLKKYYQVQEMKIDTLK